MSALVQRMLGRRWAKLAIGLVVALVVAAGASAYFTSTGSGTATGSVGSPAELTITAVTPTTGLLYPGGTGEVDATISNPNTFPVRVNSLVLDSGGIDSDQSGCDTSVLDYTTQNNGGSGWTIPPHTGAGDGTLDVQLTGAISMDTTAANECQDATFTVHLTTGP